MLDTIALMGLGNQLARQRALLLALEHLGHDVAAVKVHDYIETGIRPASGCQLGSAPALDLVRASGLQN